MVRGRWCYSECVTSVDMHMLEKRLRCRGFFSCRANSLSESGPRFAKCMDFSGRAGILKTCPPDKKNHSYCRRTSGECFANICDLERHIQTHTHQPCTVCTEGVVSSLSGSRLISFMMLDSRTGSSCLKKAKDVFSQALMDPGGTQSGKM